MAVAVRLLGDGDLELLARAEPDVFDRAVDPVQAAAFLRDPRHHLAAAIADGRVAGFVSAVDYWHPDKPRELWINEVGVAPRLRRRGVGSRLLGGMLDHGRELGCVEAWVLTEAGNAAAIALYARLGGVRSREDWAMFTFDLAGGSAG